MIFKIISLYWEKQCSTLHVEPFFPQMKEVREISCLKWTFSTRFEESFLPAHDFIRKWSFRAWSFSSFMWEKSVQHTNTTPSLFWCNSSCWIELWLYILHKRCPEKDFRVFVVHNCCISYLHRYYLGTYENQPA